MLKLAAAAVLLPSLAAASAIDLHLHVRMDVSSLGVFRGRPTRAAAGRAPWRNQASLADLEKADVRLVMATLYSPAILSSLRGGHHAFLLEQARAVEAWAAESGASLVRSPEQAEEILRSKAWRLGVILAVEGAQGLEDEEKLEALWDRGVRMVTIAHLTDSAWAGAADVRYFPSSSCRPGGKASERRSAAGLTELGRRLTDRAVERGMILDLAHASDKTSNEVIARFPGLPLMYSHEGARELTPCERMISPELLRKVRASRGLVGLTFATMYVGDDLAALERHAQALAREAGPEAVALGSDLNGTIEPVGSYAEVVKALRDRKIPADRSAEAFVRFWKRTLAYKR